MAVFTPMPSAIVPMAANANPGDLRNQRSARNMRPPVSMASVIVIAVVFGFGFLDDAFLPADVSGALTSLEGRGGAAAGRAHGKGGRLLLEVLALAGRTHRR